jgi:outer membrane lipoprotein carrier protein
MKIKKLLSTALFLAISLQANIYNLSSLESNFSQSITNDQNAKIVYHGKMYAKRENNQALWRYTSPINKDIYYKGGKLIIIEPDLEQVIYAKMDKIPNILTILDNAVQIGENRLQTSFNNINYNITMNGNKIDKIEYKDEMENRVKITFTNENVNHKINNSVFNFIIPEDYDILEQN